MNQKGEVLSVRSSDHSACVPRPLVQLPCAAVADGLVPLHATHLLPEADVQHGHQGGQACGRSRADLFARVEQLGLCRVYGKNVQGKEMSPPGWRNFYFVAVLKPKSSVVGLLNQMTAKFGEDPPLSAKATVENKDPHELLAFVSNLQVNDGNSTDAQRMKSAEGFFFSFFGSFISSLVPLRFSQTAGQNGEQGVGHWGRRPGDGVSHEHSVKGNQWTLLLHSTEEWARVVVGGNFTLSCLGLDGTFDVDQ